MTRRPVLALLLAVRLVCPPLLAALALAVGATPAAARDPDPVGVWPLSPQPEVVRGFDPPTDPWGAGHRGVDLRGSPGQPVRAALAGEVTFAGLLAGRGVVVVAHADGTRTTYEPVTVRVAVGDTVAAGDRLGLLAWAGTHCPPASCLHWGWRRGETYLDPLGLVGGGPVRLLPLWRETPADATGATVDAAVAVAGAPLAPAWAGWQPLARAGWGP